MASPDLTEVAERPDHPGKAPAKFVTGSTMRHVIVMTLTGSLGLSFLFLVDFLALWWISRLDNEVLITAIGFAGTIQFFVMSVAVGMMIGAVALVSRALGMGDPEEARRIATSAMVYGATFQTALAILVFIFRRDILIWTGAEGEALEVAVDFLGISLPSLPFVAIGMCASAVLRAAGEAWRSMMVTVSAGVVALIVDPILIVWMGWGVSGAALAIVMSRFAMAVMGFYWVSQSRNLLARPSLIDLRAFLMPFAAIAIPAVATQVSTPFGNWILVRAMAQHGDSAVAGLGVVMRLTIVCFGGIFALSGAIGGIIGQNYGAKQYDRVAQAYVDALKFCAVYTAVIWVLLILSADMIATSFGLGEEGAQIVRTFAYFAAGTFVFTGALFVSNAAFNNLGRPLWATAANWARDAILMAPLAFGLGALYAGGGVIMGQALANTLAGIMAAWIGWRFVRRLSGRPAPVLDGRPAST
ncbi:MAG: MATE family efflux transporter [Rhodobacterales bacterium]|nr:MATE family efflux transporter [Rhodobacterales bacterium]MDX5412318.1 MATE family efflux transporter [Rhodobacterales bacterium]